MRAVTFILCLLAAAGQQSVPSQDAGWTALDSVVPQAMKEHHVPGISIAVVRDGRIAWTRTFGFADVSSRRPVDPATRFQAASISKPVAAAAALHMAQYGNFSLDEDVNGKLSSWKVPVNSFDQTEKVTLRRLLSHTAGLTVHGFPGYEKGQPIPTVVQILNGEKPANTKPVVVAHTPGSRYQYSGGGYTVAQLLMTERMKKPFPEIISMTVLKSAGMTNSGYDAPPETSLALAYDREGKPVPGGWHIYPEAAAAGLWTTPSDLAKFALEIRRAARGEPSRVLQRSMAEQMLKPVLDRYGLGFSSLPAGDSVYFGHSGSNVGYRCLMLLNLATGEGAAIMTNSDFGDRVSKVAWDSLAAAYHWPPVPRN